MVEGLPATILITIASLPHLTTLGPRCAGRGKEMKGVEESRGSAASRRARRYLKDSMEIEGRIEKNG